jgi:osmotically-inducible protein OsmY
MLRFLFRIAVVGVLLAGGAYWLGYRWDDTTERRVRAAGAEASAAAAALADKIDGERVREKGAEIAGKLAQGAGRAEEALAETRLTAKIKAKMALDDTLEAGRINIDTQGTVVTLRGSVEGTAQRRRAVQLARETEGVSSVVDRLEVARP